MSELGYDILLIVTTDLRPPGVRLKLSLLNFIETGLNLFHSAM